jgi:hypothetical protein
LSAAEPYYVEWIAQSYRPYSFDYKYREIDATLPKYKKVVLRSQYTVEDTYEYLLDIINGRENAVIFKTAGFVKRQVN